MDSFSVLNEAPGLWWALQRSFHNRLHLVLSDASMTRKRHGSVTSIVMGAEQQETRELVTSTDGTWLFLCSSEAKNARCGQVRGEIQRDATVPWSHPFVFLFIPN